jgi:hypothetical protein
LEVVTSELEGMAGIGHVTTKTNIIIVTIATITGMGDPTLIAAMIGAGRMILIGILIEATRMIQIGAVRMILIGANRMIQIGAARMILIRVGRMIGIDKPSIDCIVPPGDLGRFSGAARFISKS